MQIDIWSDVVCPWCYIGKRRVEKALRAWGGEATVTWKPFELDSSTPLDGADHHGYLEAKFGGPERAKAMLDRVTQLAVDEALDYRWDLIEVRPNTRRAHALIELAGRRSPALQDAVVEACFRAYFTEGRNISDIETLVTVGADAGLVAEQIRALLHDDAAVAAVAEVERQGVQLGITGVPFSVVDGRYGISGAQEVEAFVSILRQVETELDL